MSNRFQPPVFGSGGGPPAQGSGANKVATRVGIGFGEVPTALPPVYGPGGHAATQGSGLFGSGMNPLSYRVGIGADGAPIASPLGGAGAAGGAGAGAPAVPAMPTSPLADIYNMVMNKLQTYGFHGLLVKIPHPPSDTGLPILLQRVHYYDAIIAEIQKDSDASFIVDDLQKTRNTEASGLVLPLGGRRRRRGPRRKTQRRRSRHRKSKKAGKR